MSYTDYIEGKNTVLYSDGLCLKDDMLFQLEGGIWYFPYKYKISLFKLKGVDNNIEYIKTLKVPENIFLYLEEEAWLKDDDTYSSVTINYYDLNFMREQELKKLLEKRIDLINLGNILNWKNRLAIMDWVFRD